MEFPPDRLPEPDDSAVESADVLPEIAEVRRDIESIDGLPLADVFKAIGDHIPGPARPNRRAWPVMAAEAALGGVALSSVVAATEYADPIIRIATLPFVVITVVAIGSRLERLRHKLES